MNQVELFDATVVESRISGKGEAKELTEKELKTLVLNRGRLVKHHKDYPIVHGNLCDCPSKNKISKENENKYQVRRCVNRAPMEDVKHIFVSDLEHPYIEAERFD